MIRFGHILDFLVLGGVQMVLIVGIVCYTCSLRAKSHCLILVVMILVFILTVMLKR